MRLIPLPAFQDNYLWFMHDGRRALVVDPGDAQPVLDALQRESLELAAILVTHHHPDHVGGADALRDATGAKVYGPAHEKIPEPVTRLEEGDRIEVLPDRVLLYAADGDQALAEVHNRALTPVSTLVRRSTLEDVFLRLTGRSLVD